MGTMFYVDSRLTSRNCLKEPRFCQLGPNDELTIYAYFTSFFIHCKGTE